VRDRLLGWFDRHARPFPWRGRRRRGFEVLVAETLLQQTQAARAVPASLRFLQRFPDAETLAGATPDEVLALWQGLGYYQRALRLLQAAREVVQRHAGQVPDDLDALQALPGVGRYTARAIASQAFGRPLIAVDANVRRLGSRVLSLREAGVREIESGLATLLLQPGGGLDARRAEVAEALIELGARLCRPRRPACPECPLRPACQAAVSGDPEAYPAPRPSPARRPERLRLLVARRNGDVALCRRPRAGRWAGLWGFPTLPEGATDPPGRPLQGFRHVLSHRELQVCPREVRPERAPAGAMWLPLFVVAAGGLAHPVAAVDVRLAALLQRDDVAGGPRSCAPQGAGGPT
jgi:A/G-specific adenine glycosylase